MKAVPAGTERRQLDEEMPQGIERRLVLRLLAYWRSLCGDRRMPSCSDIDPAAIPEIWPYAFILSTDEKKDEFVFQALGDQIDTISSRSLTGSLLTDAPFDSLPGIALAYAGEVLEKAVPISRGGEFLTLNGAKVLYRSILLPLGTDDTMIDGLLGAANWREIVGH